MKVRAIVATLVLGAAPGWAQVAEVSPAGALRLSYGGVPIITSESLLLMDADWHQVDAPLRAKPVIERGTEQVTARFESPLGTVARTVRNLPDGVRVEWDIDLKPAEKGKYVELCLGIPAAVLADRPQTERGMGAHASAESLALSSFLGEFVCDVRGSSHSWNLDDLRRVEWSKAFRLRFAPPYSAAEGLRAVAVLALKAKPTESAAFVKLDVAAAGNRALADETADDGAGGWTDQGANDLRVYRPGTEAYLGVPLTVGEKVALLRGEPRPAFPQAAGPIPVGCRAERLYLLHTAAWSSTFRQPIAEYLVRYQDGTTLAVPVRQGVEVNDWWGAVEPLEARLAWTGDNGQATVGLYLQCWRNPRPEASVESLTVRSKETAAVPILLAATALVAEKLSPEQLQLLDTAWAERKEPKVDTSTWFPCPIAWNDGIVAGSALDLSGLNDPPAGKHGFLTCRDGRFAFQRGGPVRFWGTNAALHGPFPAKDDAPGIARCLARQGVNLVRLHLYAVYEDTLIAPDGSLNPDALDRFEFFIAQLKENGVYTYMDLNDGMFYDRLAGRKLPAGNNELKFVSLFDPELIEAQQKLARMLFGHLNPYTKLRMCDDPAVALYEITNENSLTMGWGELRKRCPEPYYTALRGRWAAWLKEQGKPDRDLPINLGEHGGDADSLRFAAELQRRYLETMRDYLRDLGVKAPICGTNITFTPADLWASQGMDYTNDHAYADHPNVRVRPMTYHNRPTVSSAAWSLPMIPSFARADLAGKPVVASEWNYCHPNDYRCEGLPLMAAHAAYQDWDGLLFYCATGSFDGGRWQRFHDNPGILVHSQQTDPATWGLSQLCGLLYRRGDVRPAERVIRLRYGPEQLWSGRSALATLPFLPALARVETELVTEPATWPMAEVPATPAEAYADACRRLGSQGGPSLVVSDTGELRRDTAAGLLTVDTPRTQLATGFLSKLDAVRLGRLTIRCATRFATIGLTSLDGQPLERSGRMLLVAVANARNTGQVAEAGRLESGGQAPVLAEPVTATVSLQADAPRRLRVLALDTLTGQPTGPVPVSAEGESLTLALPTEPRSIYYELTRSAP